MTPGDLEGVRVALSVNYMKFRAYKEKVPALQLESAKVGAWMS